MCNSCAVRLLKIDIAMLIISDKAFIWRMFGFFIRSCGQPAWFFCVSMVVHIPD